MDKKSFNKLIPYLRDCTIAFYGEYVPIYDGTIEPTEIAWCTEKGIYLNYKHEILNNFNLEKQIIIIIGVFTHELMHKIYSDFDVLQYGLKKYNNDRKKQRLVQSIANLVEDPAIEYFSRYKVGGKLFKCLMFAIKSFYDLQPKINTARSPIEQVLNAFIMFGDLGIIKGDWTFPEAREAFIKSIDIFDRAIEEPSASKRFRLAEEIADIIYPLAENDEDFENQMDNFDSKRSENGQGSNPSGKGKSKEELSEEDMEDNENNSSSNNRKNKDKTKNDTKNCGNSDKSNDDKQEKNDTNNSSNSNSSGKSSKNEKNNSSSKNDEEKEDDNSNSSQSNSGSDTSDNESNENSSLEDKENEDSDSNKSDKSGDDSETSEEDDDSNSSQSNSDDDTSDEEDNDNNNNEENPSDSSDNTDGNNPDGIEGNSESESENSENNSDNSLKNKEDFTDAGRQDLSGNIEDYSSNHTMSLDEGEEAIVNDEYELTEEEIKSICSEVKKASEINEYVEARESDYDFIDNTYSIEKYGKLNIKVENSKMEFGEKDYYTLQALYKQLIEKNGNNILLLNRKLSKIFRQDKEEKEYRTSGSVALNRLASGRMSSRMFTKTRQPKNKQQMKVCLLIDESGSMGSANKCLMAKNIAITIAEVFGKLNIPLSVIGFTTGMGKYDVNQHHYLHWDNTPHNRLKLLNISSYNCNFDAYTIRYATEMMKKKKSEYDIMIVISDGEPSYGMGGRAERFADTANAIKEAKKSVGNVIGIGLGNIDTAVFQRFYGKDFIHVKNIDDLPIMLINAIKNIVKKW